MLNIYKDYWESNHIVPLWHQRDALFTGCSGAQKNWLVQWYNKVVAAVWTHGILQGGWSNTVVVLLKPVASAIIVNL